MINLIASLKEKYTVDNQSRNHQWYSDEPIDEGGADVGPRPTELLLSAIASCKLITIKMYADRKGWILNDVKIDLTLDKVERMNIITQKLNVDADLNELQIKRIHSISSRCPVALMMGDNVEFKYIE
ncbi:MAG: OsmC family protein [Flavobacteriales bacterium]|nr:OsmC family protein [Flavobacteriales bacterium]